MDPSLCANGCGFYGSSANLNLCSKCYKDHVAEIEKKSTKSAEALKGEIDIMTSDFLVLGLEDSASASVSGSTSVKKKKKKRCKSCNRRVGVTGFECRCGGVFCGSHRYPEEQACTVDYKAIGRQLITKQNPICKADKLEGRI